MTTAWRDLADRGRLHTHVLLGQLTTYKLGGPARLLVEAQEVSDLELVAAGLEATRTPVLVLGRGSNVLISDRGFDGVVVHLGAGFSSIRHQDRFVVAGAAASLPQLARTTAKAGLGGLEFFVGIPGSVGGAVRMNAGCHGSETVDVMASAEVFDLSEGTATTRTADQLEFGYRHSNLGDLEIVIEATFRVTPVESKEVEAIMRDVSRWRKRNQPGGTLNAGSVFKNPDGDSAGRIIDELGLKGYSIGRVSVSMKHANFIVAERGATAGDVRHLINSVRALVLERSGVDLSPEIRFFGDFEDEESNDSND